MIDPDTLLQRLAAAARRAPVAVPGELPFGMAARVLANVAQESARIAMERLGWRSLAMAVVVCAGCVVWDLATPRPNEDDLLATQLTAAPFQP